MFRSHLALILGLATLLVANVSMAQNYKLRAGQKQLACERDLALIARVLASTVRIDARFFRERVGVGERARRENRKRE